VFGWRWQNHRKALLAQLVADERFQAVEQARALVSVQLELDADRTENLALTAPPFQRHTCQMPVQVPALFPLLGPDQELADLSMR